MEWRRGAPVRRSAVPDDREAFFEAVKVEGPAVGAGVRIRSRPCLPRDCLSSFQISPVALPPRKLVNAAESRAIIAAVVAGRTPCCAVVAVGASLLVNRRRTEPAPTPHPKNS